MKSTFVKNISITSIGSIISFIISFLLTPIMTRIYDSHAYGTFGLINSIVAFLTILFTLSFGALIPIEKSLLRQKMIILSMIKLIFIGLAFSILLSFFLFYMYKDFAFLLLPLLYVGISLYRVFQGVLVKFGDFKILTLGKLIQAFTSKSFAILFGYFITGYSFFIVFFEGLGYFIQLFLFYEKRKKYFGNSLLGFKRHSLKKIFLIIKKYSDYSFLLTFINLINLGFFMVLNLVFSYFYSLSYVGFFNFSFSMLNIPVQIFSMAISSVIYHKLINLNNEHPQYLYSFIIKLVSLLFILGIIIYSLFFIYGKEIFIFTFGNDWEFSGVLASIISISILFHFVTLPFTSIFRVKNKLKLQFIIESVFTSLMIIIICFLALKNYDFVVLVQVFSILFLANKIVLLISILFVSKVKT